MSLAVFENIKRVGIVGAGQMGAGIAQVLAQSQFEVLVTDVSEEALKKGVGMIQKSLSKLAEKGKIAESVETIMGRLQTSMHLEDHQNSQFVIEAVSENEELKRMIFRKLDDCLGTDAIIATNTSSLPITRLGASTKRADRFVGMHFMNPVPLISLVEIIRGHSTSDLAYEVTKKLAEKMGKTTICVKDYPGFVVNRILIPMINEGFFALMEGVSSAEDIDTAMKLGTNQPMGPLALADFIGLDTCLAIMNVLHHGLGDPKYRPSPLLKRYVDAGLLGRKVGQGVYRY